ncbi:methyl-accepting chemotaxis protein McpB [Lachnospiraceae bacterium]|nr:methyl-accepting chemotaxis protein McpB [Lachnospiraceae bacterium]
MTKKTKFISIKIKLLGIIMPVIFVIMTVLTGLSYYVSKSVIQSNAHDLLQTSVESQAAEMEAWLERNLVSVGVAKQAIEEMGFDDAQLQDFLDSYYNYDNNYSEGFYIADAEGTLFQAKPVKSVELRAPDAEGNYLNNGNFSIQENLADDKDWMFFTALEGVAEAQIQEGEAVIDITNEGTVDYSVQFVQPNIPVKQNATYSVQFDAYANEERTMKVSVTAPDREYKRYLEDTVVNLTTEKQTYSYEFSMTDYDDANARMEFNLGAAGSTAGVKISNVSFMMNKQLHTTKDTEQIKNTDVTQTEWFRDGLTRVNVGFTNAYTNESGVPIISVCGTLRTDSNDVRVIAMDLSLDKISVYVNSFVKMENAEAFLVNANDNTILASRDKTMISKQMDTLDSSFMREIADKISQREMNLMEIDGNITVFQEIFGTDWVLVSYVPAATVYRDLNGIRNIMILFGVVSILALTVLIERIIHVVIHPVQGLTEVIRNMTGGNFTPYKAVGSSDEIGIMSRCVEQFIITMRGMLASIDSVSHILHDQADNSKKVSGQMFDASKKQNQSMKDLNLTVEQLSVSVNEIAKSATILASLVAETKEDGDGMNGRMKETVSISQKGKEVMQGVDTAMQRIDNSVRQLQRAIDQVGNASGEITNITRVIGDIADETNLLSLNASIEAARAGAAGKGFTVVALEIGKLAQTSMDSVKHIDNLVLEIQALIGDVIEQANGSVENINSSSALIGNAVITYDTIFENIAVVGELAQQMIQKVEQVEDVARNVAAISEEQAASSQEILSSSDILVEQADGLMTNSEIVAKESEELTTSAEALESQIQMFQV